MFRKILVCGGRKDASFTAKEGIAAAASYYLVQATVWRTVILNMNWRVGVAHCKAWSQVRLEQPPDWLFACLRCNHLGNHGHPSYE